MVESKRRRRLKRAEAIEVNLSQFPTCYLMTRRAENSSLREFSSKSNTGSRELVAAALGVQIYGFEIENCIVLEM